MWECVSVMSEGDSAGVTGVEGESDGEVREMVRSRERLRVRMRVMMWARERGRMR